MISDRTKLLCLMAAFAITAGCGGGGSENSGGSEIADPLVAVEDPIVATDDAVVATTEATDGSEISDVQVAASDDPDITVIAAPEVADSVETSEATATPVTSVSSSQMDAYIENPLVAAIPAELSSDISTTLPGFITNPLLN